MLRQKRKFLSKKPADLEQNGKIFNQCGGIPTGPTQPLWQPNLRLHRPCLVRGVEDYPSSRDDAALSEGNPRRPIYRLDEYEVRKRTLKTSLERWGICVLAPMLNEEGTQVDGLGIAGLDGGLDLVVALKILSKKYSCNRMEVLERFFPEVNDHMLNDRTAVVATSLADLELLFSVNDRSMRLYGPIYDGLVLGALAQPGWMAGVQLNSTDRDALGGASLSFGYFRWQGFPCSKEVWQRAYPEEPRPGSRKREVQCHWPSMTDRKRRFSSKQKRWVVIGLKASSMALFGGRAKGDE